MIVRISNATGKGAGMPLASWTKASSGAPWRGAAVRRMAAVALLGVVPFGSTGYAQTASPPEVAGQTNEPAVTPKRAYPKVSLADNLQVSYAGEISSEGKIRKSWFHRFSMRFKKSSTANRPLTVSESRVLHTVHEQEKGALPQDLPPNVERQQSTQSIEDFQPPEHATQIAKGRSLFGSMMDSVVSFAYGSKQVLVAPDAVTTDAHNRVIIADTAAHSVTVLARDAKKSFQIVGGPGKRLQSPVGVAVDGDGNIYVSDSKRGLIFVYDPSGQFLRTLGKFGNEGILHKPAGIAIDPRARRLYVLDPPIHTLFIFDLKGTLLQRVEPREGEFSARKGRPGPGEFQHPRIVFVRGGEIVVRDATRVHILNLQGKFLREFPVPEIPEEAKGPVPGLFMDKSKHIFVADASTQTVREYSQDGKLLDAFGRPGIEVGEFSLLAGMWANSKDRVYIIDGNRIQIFKLERR